MSAFSGLVGSAGIWLYAESANGNDGGEDSRGIHARSLLLLPPSAWRSVSWLLVLGTFGQSCPRLGGVLPRCVTSWIAFPR